VSDPAFVTIPDAFLSSIASGCDRIPTLYYQSNFVVRYYYWRRLTTIFEHILRSGVARRECLDFGGGGGVFLPTLSRAFDHVTLMDLITGEAARVVEKFGLRNVTLQQQDVRDGILKKFDVIIAADVLEHFERLDIPIRVIKDALKNDGLLVTSLPTENFLYEVLRKAFGVEKPIDHYHTAYGVERHLIDAGFVRLRTTHIPTRLAPLYLITSWTSGKS
jgi:predicted TPR repeat methyltransferase